MKLIFTTLSVAVLTGCGTNSAIVKQHEPLVSQGETCATIKAEQKNSSDGYYVIDPDNQGALAPIKVYCDMTSQGGGWTLFAHHSDGLNRIKVSNTVSKTRFSVIEKKYWTYLRASMEVGLLFIDEQGRTSMMSAAKLHSGNCESIDDMNHLADYSKDGFRHLWHHENRGCDGRGLDYSVITLQDSTYKNNNAAGAALYQLSSMKFDLWPYGAATSSYKAQDTLLYFIK